MNLADIQNAEQLKRWRDGWLGSINDEVMAGRLTQREAHAQGQCLNEKYNALAPGFGLPIYPPTSYEECVVEGLKPEVVIRATEFEYKYKMANIDEAWEQGLLTIQRVAGERAAVAGWFAQRVAALTDPKAYAAHMEWLRLEGFQDAA